MKFFCLHKNRIIIQFIFLLCQFLRSILHLCLFSLSHPLSPLHSFCCFFGIDTLESFVTNSIKFVKFFDILLFNDVLFVIEYNLKVLILLWSLGEILGVLITTYWFKGRLHFHNVVPGNIFEKWMILNLRNIFWAQSLLWVHAEELIYKICSLRRHLIFSSTYWWKLDISC